MLDVTSLKISCSSLHNFTQFNIQVRQLAAVLARCKGVQEGEVTSQLFGRLSLALMRANAVMISSRCQDADFPLTHIDGIE